MKVFLISLVAGLFILTVGFKVNHQPKPWPVPDAAAKKANPVKSSSESVSAGKALWSQHCSSCHGKTGKGDGVQGSPAKNPTRRFVICCNSIPIRWFFVL